MWLFDEFLQNDVQQNVYRTKNNEKIKKERKWRIEFEDRLLTKKELQHKHKLEYNREFWRKRVADNQEFNKEMYAERDEYWRNEPTPLYSPNEIDNLYLNEHLQDIGGERYVGERPKWKTAYWTSFPRRYFDITCPIKIIPSRGLEMRYNQGMDVQLIVADFLKWREDEIRKNYRRKNFELKEWFNNWVAEYIAKTPRTKKIKKEWRDIYWWRGCSVMSQAVIHIAKFWYYTPLQWMHWVGFSFLIGDTIFDWFWHCDYVSRFWNWDYMQHWEYLHQCTQAIRNPEFDKNLLQKIPFFRIVNPIMVRVPANSMPVRKMGEHYLKGRPEPDELIGKENNCEWDYYWTSLLPTRDFPKWKEIVKRFGFNEEEWIEYKPYLFNKEYNQQPLMKGSRLLYQWNI